MTMVQYMIETIHLFQDQLLREAEAERLVHEAIEERRARRFKLPLWTSTGKSAPDKGLVDVHGKDADGEANTTTISLN